MTKGRIDKKQRLADQRRKRAQAATGLAQAPRSPVRKRPPAGLSPAHYPVKRSSLGAPQVALALVAPLGRADK
jgi:hypothetical protein